jgi:hypothetical protein
MPHYHAKTFYTYMADKSKMWEKHLFLYHAYRPNSVRAESSLTYYINNVCSNLARNYMTFHAPHPNTLHLAKS